MPAGEFNFRTTPDPNPESELPLSVGRLDLLIGDIASGARVLVQIGNALWSVTGKIDQDGDLMLTPDEVEGRVIRS